MLCQLVVPVVMDFSREVTGARRLEMEQGAMVNSTPTSRLGCIREHCILSSVFPPYASKPHLCYSHGW